MEKYNDPFSKYYSYRSDITKRNDPILIEDRKNPQIFSQNIRRHSLQKEDFNNRTNTPKFLKKMEFCKLPEKRKNNYYQTTQSLIVTEAHNNYRQRDSSKNYIPQSHSHLPWTIKTTQKQVNRSCFKQVNMQQKLTFNNFLEQAKKQKQRNIFIPSTKTPSKISRFNNKIDPCVIEQLRETEDTVANRSVFTEKLGPKVSDFKKLKLLGKGKNGQVYLVIHKKTGFACAMKIIKKKDINRGTAAQRQTIHNQLLRQIKIQMSLSHPNIVQLYGVFADKENIYLIQQLGLNGQLYELMKKKQKFSEQSTALLAREVLKGLNGLHQKNIIHRDIKPQNIVLVFGIAKLCDFGWSVHCPVQLRSTLCGTPLYLSPQILVGQQYNQKIDIWAFGTLVYQLFTGENPFKIKSKGDLKKIITDDVMFSDNFPRRLRKFLDFILKKNSSERPTAQQLQKHEFLKKYAQLETSQQISCL